MSDSEKATWEVCDDLMEIGRVRRFVKKHAAEYASCMRNLDRLLALLNTGIPFRADLFGFLRSEGGNLYRIGQSGLVGAMETRLYVYIRIANKNIFVITVGDKNSQPDDINRAKAIIQKYERMLNDGEVQ